jgi:predicted ATP-grasp superfamily ATP-dependent carboligase
MLPSTEDAETFATIEQHAWPQSLLAEGRAMILALATDALAIPGMEIQLLWDHRLALPELPAECLHVVADSASAQQAFAAFAAEADGTLVVAPESEGALSICALAVEMAGGRLLGPTPDLIALCSDKQRTAEHLNKAGICVPYGVRIAPGEELPADFPYPAVLKPLDGCGSQDVRLLTAWPDSGNPLRVPARLEQFCPGEAVSVAALCGCEKTGEDSRQKLLPLPACRQLLAGDGSFAYRGGSLPLPADLAQRAESLVLGAVASLPQPLGYLGVDLVLGVAADGSQDFVIEINPRLTTSYIGLRQATDDNLLLAWLQLACGEPVSLKFSATPIQFQADGQVTK